MDDGPEADNSFQYQKTEDIKDEIMQNPEKDEDLVETALSEKGSAPTSEKELDDGTQSDEDGDDKEFVLFNGDLRCEHGLLLNLLTAKRRMTAHFQRKLERSCCFLSNIATLSLRLLRG